MEYRMNARLFIADNPELETDLAKDKKLKKLNVLRSKKNANVLAQVGRLEFSEVFAIDIVFDDVRDVMRTFDKIQKAMVKDNISGWVAWHTCREDEGLPCEITDRFEHKATVGGEG